MDSLFGVDDARVGFDAVALGRRRLDLEADLAVRRVGEAHGGRDLAREGAWKKKEGTGNQMKHAM